MSRPVLTALARGSAGIFIALAFLAGIELVFTALDLPDPGLYDGDPNRVWWLRPSLDRDVPFVEEGSRFHVRTNALGLRGAPPPQGDWTLALGCSTTFGWGVEAEQAWPAVLSSLTGQPIVNGGIPGWSTFQALLGADRYLELRPRRVILAYLVRDAQAARAPDSASRPSPWLLQTRLVKQLLLWRKSMRREAVTGSGAPGPADPAQARVSPREFEQNLRELIRRAAPAEVVLLAFPQRDPPRPWIDAMKRVAPTLEPTLPADAFFPHDPIHLTADGHRQLAAWLARSLERPPAP